MEKMTEREKRIAIIAVVVIVIILLLFWLRKKRQVIPVYNDTDLTWDLGDVDINLGDLIVPDLSFFTGVSSCGCGDGPAESPSMPSAPVAPVGRGPAAIVPINYQTPAPPRRMTISGGGAPRHSYEHNNNFLGGNWSNFAGRGY